MIQFKIKPFNEFSITELYETLQLRSEVFVVEQNCVYQDIDGKDEKALHVLGYYKMVIWLHILVCLTKAIILMKLRLDELW